MVCLLDLFLALEPLSWLIHPTCNRHCQRQQAIRREINLLSLEILSYQFLQEKGGLSVLLYSLPDKDSLSR